MIRSRSVFIALCTIFGLSALAAYGQEGPDPSLDTQAAICTKQDLTPLGQPVDGFAKLCIGPGGATGLVQARNLAPGNAYTLWFIYINDPASCQIPNQCSLVDFGGDNPLGVFGRFDSAVAPVNGQLRFSGKVAGFQPSRHSQIWLLMYSHGPADYADGRHLARQLLTPEDPDAGAPHLGNIVDGPRFVPAGISVFVLN